MSEIYIDARIVMAKLDEVLKAVGTLNSRLDEMARPPEPAAAPDIGVQMPVTAPEPAAAEPVATSTEPHDNDSRHPSSTESLS